MSDCLFCKIIDGSIPSTKIYEDEHVYAFTDISPVAKGHTLLIPKHHCKDLFEMPEDVARNLYAVAPKIANAIKAAFNPLGLNTINNNGAAAGQTVFHYHLHFIPRYDEKEGLGLIWETRKYTPEQLTEVAESIKANLNH
ncbi:MULTISPECIES: HIT family protein [unclassified Lysinibacillus]|uniref:HIT family protein n=1 Tax=unclassified Lysinibacillus TaxID=2636778 RepID=UPI0020136009|nr:MULTISPECIES: HIT family protein [unclassified Lysinibacillus]MCL1698701.1 HIT family protein [Lysinibacillus sp. BPa_S21]MCL1703127.1 HIT family protein [Lysinibacillus sp. Bpr_S20]